MKINLKIKDDNIHKGEAKKSYTIANEQYINNYIRPKFYAELEYSG